MAARKPAIGFGPISDDLVKMLLKGARTGTVGSAKRAQTRRITEKLVKRGGAINAKTGEHITKGYVKEAKIGRRELMQMAPADEAYMAARKAKKAAVTKRAKQVKANGIAEQRAQRAIESNAAKKKLTRSYDKRLNRIDLAEKRGAGNVTKSRSTGKPTVYGAKGQAAERSKAGAIQGGTRNANIRAKAKAEDLVRQLRATKDPVQRRAIRAKIDAHKKKTGF
jgi:hypothetical protein